MNVKGGLLPRLEIPHRNMANIDPVPIDTNDVGLIGAEDLKVLGVEDRPGSGNGETLL